jgi:hypothetical protein
VVDTVIQAYIHQPWIAISSTRSAWVRAPKCVTPTNRFREQMCADKQVAR